VHPKVRRWDKRLLAVFRILGGLCTDPNWPFDFYTIAMTETRRWQSVAFARALFIHFGMSTILEGLVTSLLPAT